MFLCLVNPCESRWSLCTYPAGSEGLDAGSMGGLRPLNVPLDQLLEALFARIWVRGRLLQQEHGAEYSMDHRSSMPLPHEHQ